MTIAERWLAQTKPTIYGGARPAMQLADGHRLSIQHGPGMYSTPTSAEVWLFLPSGVADTREPQGWVAFEAVDKIIAQPRWSRGRCPVLGDLLSRGTTRPGEPPTPLAGRQWRISRARTSHKAPIQ